MQCNNCKEERNREMKEFKESSYMIQNLVTLPVKTKKKKFAIVACPTCDGNLASTVNRE